MSRTEWDSSTSVLIWIRELRACALKPIPLVTESFIYNKPSVKEDDIASSGTAWPKGLVQTCHCKGAAYSWSFERRNDWALRSCRLYGIEPATFRSCSPQSQQPPLGRTNEDRANNAAKRRIAARWRAGRGAEPRLCTVTGSLVQRPPSGQGHALDLSAVVLRTRQWGGSQQTRGEQSTPHTHIAQPALAGWAAVWDPTSQLFAYSRRFWKE